MTPGRILFGLASSVLLIAGGLSRCVGRVGERWPPAPAGNPLATSAAGPEAITVTAGWTRAARRAEAEAQSEMDASLGGPADIDSAADAEAHLAVVETWVGEVPLAQFRSVLERLSEVDQAGLVGQLLVRRWTALAPRAAGEWTEQLAETEARGVLQAAVALAWAETDLAGALAWAGGLSGTSTSEHVLTGLGYETAREYPVVALQLAVGLSPTTERDALILHGARQWAAVDAGAARAWLLQWPESELREHALADFATVLADQDGEAGARFAIEHPATGPDFERAIIGVIQRWSQQDLPAAQAWIETFPPTTIRDRAVQVVAPTDPPPEGPDGYSL